MNPAAFPCGHPRSPDNSRKCGNGYMRCKTCHNAKIPLYRKAAMQRYRERDRPRYNAYQAAWKRTDRLVRKLLGAVMGVEE